MIFFSPLPLSLPYQPRVLPNIWDLNHCPSTNVSNYICWKYVEWITHVMKSLFPYLKSCFPPIQGLCLIFSHPLFLHLIVAMGSKIPNFLAFSCRTYNIIQNSYAPKGAIALLRSPFLTGLSGGVGSSSSVSTKNFLLWPVREPWKIRWVNRHFDLF